MVTSHDVARLAGVSQPTVSRALRGVPGISARTIARVRDAANALGYVPSEAGRVLSTRRTNCIGIVAGELTNPFYPELIEPMRRELQTRGYRTLLIPDDSPLVMERLSDGTLDGVLVTTATEGSSIALELGARGVPFVLVNRVTGDAAADSCTFDNATGAAEAAALLVSRGHTRIGLIGGPADTSTGRERAEAFLEALAASGLALDPELIARGPFTQEAGFQSAQAMLRLADRPTAIFCGNDVIAIGARNALSALGHADVSLIGFDDIEMASWDVLRLTTIRGDLELMAREAVRLVLRRIANPVAPFERVVIPTCVVERTPV